MSDDILGRGQPVATFAALTGRVRHFRTPADVLAALDDDLEEVIALVESGGTTFLSPILGRLGAIVCRTGTLRSHLAIVSREYDLACIIGADIPDELADGTRVTIEAPDAETAIIKAVPHAEDPA